MVVSRAWVLCRSRPKRKSLQRERQREPLIQGCAQRHQTTRRGYNKAPLTYSILHLPPFAMAHPLADRALAALCSLASMLTHRCCSQAAASTHHYTTTTIQSANPSVALITIFERYYVKFPRYSLMEAILVVLFLFSPTWIVSSWCHSYYYALIFPGVPCIHAVS